MSGEEVLEADRAMAADCLRFIASEDEGIVALVASTQNGSLFPNELISSLGLFIAPEEVSQFPRLVALHSNIDQARPHLNDKALTARQIEEIEELWDDREGGTLSDGDCISLGYAAAHRGLPLA